MADSADLGGRGPRGLRPSLALLATLALGAAAPASPVQRPNFILVVAEDVGPRLGSYGDRVAHTPHLDRLAAEGLRYTRAFSTSGVCAPSRAALFMGVPQHQLGAQHMRTGDRGYEAVPPPHMKALPELLRAAGYRTLNDVKSDLQFGSVVRAPFTLWDESGLRVHWRRRPDARPFFLVLSPQHTHESSLWPLRLPRSRIEALLLPKNLWVAWQRRGHATDPRDVRLPAYYPDTPAVRADLARHYDNVAALDAAVGRVLAQLAEDGLEERTFVFFTADHGDGLPRAKRWLYDSGIHVPLLVRGPGLASGEVRGELVGLLDLAPTILSLAGAPIPAHMSGRVLLGPDPSPEPRVYVHAARDRTDEVEDRVRGVRDVRWKYLRNFHPERPYVAPLRFRDLLPSMPELLAADAAGTLSGAPALWLRRERPPEELYDTDADPDEVVNLADVPEHRDVLVRLRAELARWQAATGDLEIPEAQLRESFWPGGVQPVTQAPSLRLVEGLIEARSASEGASIGYRREGEAGWSLYTAPVPVAPGESIEARAIRYGWAESTTTHFVRPAHPRPPDPP